MTDTLSGHRTSSTRAASTALDRIVDALTALDCRPRQSGGSWSARCPAHKDSTPSLSLRGIEGQALVHCHAGCATDAVVAALGLTAADLFDEPGTGVRYTYTDAAGHPTRTVHRLPVKAFRQSGDTSSPPELYRLPQVLAAVRDGVPVLVVEGEKDVHAAESVGAVATTSPMGAANFGKVDPSPLTGAHVIVVPDDDDPGAAYGREVVAALARVAASVKVARPKVGKDLADHVAAGYGVDDLVPVEVVPTPGHRSVTLTPASTITVRPVRWLWQDRIAVGTLALIGGREGIGKSTVAYAKAADITRGRLPGVYFGQPRAVIVAATEDSWEHTIVPRLMAAGADLTRVFRVDVSTSDGIDTTLVLPQDLYALERAVDEVGAALILLDPLMSRLDSRLDTHKDADVRRALEPLVAIANRTHAAILGVIHVNKSTSTDALTLLMGSRAFTAVARAVLFVMLDPDDDGVRLMGEEKNNLGATNGLPTLAFRIESAHVADTDEGPVWTGRIAWQGDRNTSIRDALEATNVNTEDRSAGEEAAAWLKDRLEAVGGTDDSAAIKAAGLKAGHSPDALKRGRRKIKATVESSGFPRRTFWTLPDPAAQSERSSRSKSGESAPTALTAPTAPTRGSVGSVGAVGAVGAPPARGAPTDALTACRVCGDPLEDVDHRGTHPACEP